MLYAGGVDCKIDTDAEVKKLVAAALAGQLTDLQSEALAELSTEVLSASLLCWLRPILTCPANACATGYLPAVSEC